MFTKSELFRPEDGLAQGASVVGGKCVMEEKSGDVGWDNCAVPGMADSSLGHDLIRAWEKLKVF